MKRRRSPWAAALALVAMMTFGGCATQAETGTLLGAGTGAALGGAVTGSGWGALIGGALGGFVGREIGLELDRQDQARMAYALSEAPPYQPYEWVNPNTGAAWEVTPQQSYRAPQGYPCREFSMEARIGGRIEETFGTACLTPDGTWEIVS